MKYLLLPTGQHLLLWTNIPIEMVSFSPVGLSLLSLFHKLNLITPKVVPSLFSCHSIPVFGCLTHSLDHLHAEDS